MHDEFAVFSSRSTNSLMYHHQQHALLLFYICCYTKWNVLIAAVLLFLFSVSAPIVGGRQFNQFWLSFAAFLIIWRVFWTYTFLLFSFEKISNEFFLNDLVYGTIKCYHCRAIRKLVVIGGMYTSWMRPIFERDFSEYRWLNTWFGRNEWRVIWKFWQISSAK